MNAYRQHKDHAVTETWRDKMRQYRDRWIVGIAVTLSLLLHVGLAAIFFGGVTGFGKSHRPTDTIDFDLTDMAALEDALKNTPDPDRYLHARQQSNQRVPEKADAFSFENHDAGQSTHMADRPINEFQRRLGPQGPGASPSPPGSPGARGSPQPGRKTPPMPQVGQGVGSAAGTGAQKAASASQAPPGSATGAKNVNQLLARTGMAVPAGGGENGVNPYNPSVGAAGKGLSISTKQLRYMGYFSHMREKIYLAWVYPQAAQRSGQQGVTFLRFTIEKDGDVSDARVMQSSGYRLLDDYALKAVRSAGFNSMPSHWPEKHLTISASFHYQLIGARAIR